MSAEGPLWFEGKQITPAQVDNAYYLAMESMSMLNKNAAELMIQYKCHGGTDITGFGLLGHAQNLATAQHSKVDLIIEAIPVIEHMTTKVDGMFDFKVIDGYSAETSGGILAMIESSVVDDLVREAKEKYK
jgi:selenide, water dikinase